MKSLSYFSLIFLLALTFSCGNDDEMEAAPDQLVGEWTIESLTYEIRLEGEFSGIPVSSISVGDATDISLTANFQEDPNTLVEAGSFTVIQNVEVLGTSSEMPIEFKAPLGSTTWERVDDTIVFQNDEKGEETVANILEISDTRLMFSLDQECDNPEPVAGIEISEFAFNGVYTYTK